MDFKNLDDVNILDLVGEDMEHAGGLEDLKDLSPLDAILNMAVVINKCRNADTDVYEGELFQLIDEMTYASSELFDALPPNEAPLVGRDFEAARLYVDEVVDLLRAAKFFGLEEDCLEMPVDLAEMTVALLLDKMPLYQCDGLISEIREALMEYTDEYLPNYGLDEFEEDENLK